MSAAKRLHAIPDRDNHIEIVQLDRSVGICNVQNLHITLLVQFSLIENIVNMFGNNASLTLEQFAYLLLRQPYSLVLQANFNQSFTSSAHFHTGTTGIPDSIPSSSYVTSIHNQSG